MLHAACTKENWVESRFLVVGSQIASLTPSPSFAHNLCCRSPNGSCKAIFDIYASRPFLKKKHFKARCFDTCNRVLSFRKSRRTPKSPFRECECHPHTPSKWGYDIKKNYQTCNCNFHHQYYVSNKLYVYWTSKWFNVLTLALSSHPKQGLAKVQAGIDAWESHFMLIKVL
jgi:hypothetical protein